MSTDYEKRLHVAIDGSNKTQFFTRSGALIATGYDRIVLGERGPYVEFDTSHMVSDELTDTTVSRYYYLELRTVTDNVKVYAQIHSVDYADYLPGKCYISPFELYDDTGQQLCTPLRQK